MPLGSVNQNEYIYFIVQMNSTFPSDISGSIPVTVQVFALPPISGEQAESAAELRATLSSIPSGSSSVAIGDSPTEVLSVNANYAEKGLDGGVALKVPGTYKVVVTIPKTTVSVEGTSVDIGPASFEDTFTVEGIAPTGEVSITGVSIGKQAWIIPSV